MGARPVVVGAETAKGVIHVIDTRAVGAYISQLRRDSDLTQAEMASRLNVTHQAVSKWENGLALPDVQMLMDLASLFGVSIEQILSGGSRTADGRRDSVQRGPSEAVRRMTQSMHQKPSFKQPSDEPLSAEPPSDSVPEQPDYPNAIEGEKVELNIELLSQLAPFMSRETLDRAFEKACVGEIDPCCLVGLAPFVSRDKLEKAVDLIGEGKLSAEHLSGLAPFLGREALRRAVNKIRDGSVNRNVLVSLAPFLDPDVVEALVFGKAKQE